MKVVIVEDEKLSADHLALLLNEISGEIQVLAVLDTVKATAEFIFKNKQIDLLLLDIHLADGNSFELFSKTEVDIPIIFTTAYDAYAIQAFKQNSIDYLLKPIMAHDLQFALIKYAKQKQALEKNVIENFKRAYTQWNAQYKTRFLIKSGQTIDTIPTHNIHHFVTSESLTFLITSKGVKHVIDYALDELESILQPKDFFRINRKVIININSVGKISPYFNNRLKIASGFLEGDSSVVSRERVTDFKKWLDN
jgi:DNA-binding LytR/AlgR family response regulator